MSCSSILLTRVALAALSLSLLLAAPVAKAESRGMGFSLAVSVKGIFSPTVDRAEVTAVQPGSAADATGLRPGDLLTRIEDCPIPGCPGDRAKKLLAKQAGQILRLTVMREGAERDLIVHVRTRAN